MNGQTVTVLIGNGENALTVAIRVLIEKVYGPTVRCAFTAVERLDELLAQADRNRFDLGVLILNNLLAPEVGTRNRIEQTIAAIAELEARSPMPLMAISGYAKVPDFEARVRQAGANEFLFLPLPWPECRAALSRCLRISDAARRGR